MRKKWLELVCIGLFMLTFLNGCSAKPTVNTEEVTLSVSAAASLSDVMKEISTIYETKTPGTKISCNYGASGTLQMQIEEGAPVDLFFSAAQKPMNALVGKELLLTESRVDLIQNKIVLIAAKGNPLSLSTFEDMDQAKLIALGEPESVPVGAYSKEVLTSLELWEKIQSKVTFGSNVRQVLSWVESGDADCGIVYATDAAVAGEAVEVTCEAPEGSCTPIVYPAAVLRDSTHSKEAQAFLTFLASKEVGDIFLKYGFTPL